MRGVTAPRIATALHPPFTSSVVSSPSPRQPRPTAHLANIYTGCSGAIARAVWRPSTPARDARPATRVRSATRSSSRSCGCVKGSLPTVWTPARSPCNGTWHQAGLPVPSTSTIRRILHHHGLITPQPRKRPEAPITASRPPNPTNAGNRTSPTGIWLMAPMSRSSTGSTITPDTCCAATAYRRVAGPDVVASFIATVNTYGLPASTFDRQRLGLHLTIRPRPQRVRTAPGQPGHHPKKRPPQSSPNPRQNRTLPPNPQTLAHPPTQTRHLAELQTQLDTFRALYNTQRTHRALPAHTTPAQAYTARPKAQPTGIEPTEHFRIRHDTVDQCGKLTLRYASRLHHLGIGIAHAGTKVLILVTATTVTVISKTRQPTSSPATTSTPTATTGATKTKTPADGRGVP